MDFDNAVSIGIDPSASKKKITYAAIDNARNLIALGKASFEELFPHLQKKRDAVFVIGGPPRPNAGLMSNQDIRNAQIPIPKEGMWDDLRLVEYQLLKKGYPIYKTSRTEERIKGWMENSFRLFKGLEADGISTFDEGRDAKGTFVEASPEACYLQWASHKLLPKRSLIGRMQRQLIIYELRIRISDPMIALEEITRNKIRQGKIPEGILYDHSELQAIALATLGWNLTFYPKRINLVGTDLEGKIAYLDPTRLI